MECVFRLGYLSRPLWTCNFLPNCLAESSVCQGTGSKLFRIGLALENVLQQDAVARMSIEAACRFDKSYYRDDEQPKLAEKHEVNGRRLFEPKQPEWICSVHCVVLLG